MPVKSGLGFFSKNNFYNSKQSFLKLIKKDMIVDVHFGGSYVPFEHLSVSFSPVLVWTVNISETSQHNFEKLCS